MLGLRLWPWRHPKTVCSPLRDIGFCCLGGTVRKYARGGYVLDSEEEEEEGTVESGIVAVVGRTRLITHINVYVVGVRQY